MTVTYEQHGAVALITIDDGKANAFGHDLIDQLQKAIDQAEKDAGAIVIAGRPGRFSAGFDLSVMTSGTDAARGLLNAGAQLSMRLFALKIPVVVASTGHALAMGAIMLFAADRRIGAAGNYKIGLNEVAIGMPVPQFAIALGRQSLANESLNEAINLATVYDPEGAVRVGYYDELASDEDIVARALAVATDFAERLRQGAFATTRTYLRGEALKQAEAGLVADLNSFVVDLPEN